MPIVQNIFEQKDILLYLEQRNLVKQYKNAKDYILAGNQLQTHFKERQPQGSGIWYFRINKKYRVLGTFNDEGNLIVFKIDNHQ